MTICIACVAEALSEPLVLVAADRLLTAGDIEYEPIQSKIFPLAGTVVALTAGDMTSQSVICRRTRLEVYGQDRSVREIADAYARQHAQLRLEKNVDRFLTPVGLALADFHAMLGQEQVPEFADELGRRMYGNGLEAEAIIAGVDNLGAHIYVISDPGTVQSLDDVGFASIGGGAWHAQSQFMTAGYSRAWPLSYSLFLTFLAKRRAEIAPGVGSEIDMCLLSRAALVQLPVDPVLHRMLATYQEYVVQEARAMVEAYTDVGKLVTEAMEYADKAARAEAETAAANTGADNEEGVSGGAEEGEPPTA